MCRCGCHLQQQHYGKKDLFKKILKKQLHVGILFTVNFLVSTLKLSTLCSNVVAMWSRVDQGPGIHVVTEAVQQRCYIREKYFRHVCILSVHKMFSDSTHRAALMHWSVSPVHLCFLDDLVSDTKTCTRQCMPILLSN